MHDEKVRIECHSVIRLASHPRCRHAVFGDHASVPNRPVGVIEQSVEPGPLGDLAPDGIHRRPARDGVAEEDSDRALLERNGLSRDRGGAGVTGRQRARRLIDDPLDGKSFCEARSDYCTHNIS